MWSRGTVVILCLALSCLAASSKGLEKKQAQLRSLKAQLGLARDSLRNEIAARWSAKQKQVEKREIDKEELIRLRDSQERAYIELSRSKEEAFARERLIEEERVNLQRRADEWDYVKLTLDEMLAGEADRVLGLFPLDRERARETVEAARRDYGNSKSPVSSMGDLIAYKRSILSSGTEVSLVKQTVLPAAGGAQHLTLARFGNVFAYGIAADNTVFFVRQTGRLGPGRFEVEQVGESPLSVSLREAFPQWLERGAVDGGVLTDVLQNVQSRILLSSKKARATGRIGEYVRSGGPIMVPLILLPIWALVLVILKSVEMARRHAANRKIAETVLPLLDKGDIAGAGKLVAGKRTIGARVAAACLAHTDWTRGHAEQAVEDILSEELPRLNSHLNTLAVIAGVAPLLGLLGTVTGMISLFEVITHYGTGDPKIMAGGISEALVTTQTGLTIAIPILLVHNYLRNWKNRVTARIEAHSMKVLNRLWPREE